jgi:hypothetical protein
VYLPLQIIIVPLQQQAVLVDVSLRQRTIIVPLHWVHVSAQQQIIGAQLSVPLQLQLTPASVLH